MDEVSEVLYGDVQPYYYTRISNLIWDIGLDVYERDLFAYYCRRISDLYPVVFQKRESILERLGIGEWKYRSCRGRLEELNLLASYTMPASLSKQRRVLTYVRQPEIWFSSRKLHVENPELLKYEKRTELRDWWVAELASWPAYDFGPLLLKLREQKMVNLDDDVVFKKVFLAASSALKNGLQIGELARDARQPWRVTRASPGAPDAPALYKQISSIKKQDPSTHAAADRQNLVNNVCVRTFRSARRDQAPVPKALGEGALADFQTLLDVGDELLVFAAYHLGDELGLGREWHPSWEQFLAGLEDGQLACVLTWLWHYRHVGAETHEKIDSLPAVLRRNWGEGVDRRKSLASGEYQDLGIHLSEMRRYLEGDDNVY